MDLINISDVVSGLALVAFLGIWVKLSSRYKDMISLKEEIKNLQMKQIELEKLKVNVGNTKDQVINNQKKVINNQEKEIKCLKVSLDQEKEEKEAALLKNKEQNEGILKEITYLKDREATKDQEVLKAKG